MKKPKHSEAKKVNPKSRRASEAAAVRRDNATSKRGETGQARGEAQPPTALDEAAVEEKFAMGRLNSPAATHRARTSPGPDLNDDSGVDFMSTGQFYE